MAEQKLARKIGLGLLTFYGLGTILGAGIYVLVGKVAGSAGLYAPLAFVVAALVAGVTAFSYSQLVALYPKSAGEAYYLHQGFHITWLTTLVGYLVVFTGVVSAATLAKGFVGYLSAFVGLNENLVVILVVGVMGALALWGIAESLWMAAFITIVEIAGLILVVTLTADTFQALPSMWSNIFVPAKFSDISLILAGAFLAFYAFVGFEDMVNVAEEVREPSRVMPKAILIALIVSTLLYFLVAMVAVLGMPLDELTQSKAPLKDLLASRSPSAATAVAVISLFAIINGVLTQLIMASRVLYGMAAQGRAPDVFKSVSTRFSTPWVATVVVMALILLFALALPLVALAKTTSFIILSIFALVNLALWRLKTDKSWNKELQLPSWPICGALLCLGLLIFQITSLLQ